MKEITDQQRNCKHEAFQARVNVNRFEDTGLFMADVTVSCARCDLPFRFVGLEAGINFAQPLTSIDGLELHAPIEPETETQLRMAAHFTMPAIISGRH